MCLGVPGQVLSIVDSDESLMRSATVSFGAIKKEINIAYVPEVIVGDYVIVHAGFAISRVQEEEAQRIFKTLKELDALEDEGL